MNNPSVLDAIEAVKKLDRLIKEKGHTHYNKLIIKKIDSKDIDDIEKELGIKLPPSYKTFLTVLGVFHIASSRGHDYDRLWHPTELTFCDSRFPGDQTFIRNIILFKNAPYEDNLHGFDSSRLRDDGEMPVELLCHDDLNTRGELFLSFPELVLELAQEYEDELK